MAVGTGLAPAERRDTARARAEELSQQIAALDAQLAAIGAEERQLSAELDAALRVVQRARGQVAGATTARNHAKAAALVASGTAGEADAAKRLADAEAREASARSDLEAAQETSHRAATAAKNRGEKLEARRKALAAQRLELSQLADALGVHAAEAHTAHGREQLAEAATGKRSLLARIAAAQSELGAARAQLDALHGELVPALLAEHPALSDEAAAAGLLPGDYPATALLEGYLGFLAELEQYAERRQGQPGAHVPVHFIVPGHEAYWPIVSQAMAGQRGAVTALREAAAKMLHQLQENSTGTSTSKEAR